MACLFLVGALVWPLLHLVVDVADVRAVLADGYYWKRFLITAGQGLAATLWCALLGLPAAWVLFQTRFPGHHWFLRLLLLPYLVPTVVGAMAIHSLIGPRGWLPLLADESPWLLLWGYVFYNVGIVVWMTYQALCRVPVAAIEAARVFGASPVRIMTRIIWPSIAPSVWSSLLLTFLFCSTSFGVALMLGGARWATLEVEIYTLTALQLDISSASVLAMMQAAMCLVVVWLYVKNTSRVTATVVVNHRTLPKKRPGVQGWVALGLIAFVTLGPLATLLLKSVLLDHAAYLRLFGADEFWLACANSLKFTLISLPCALMLGWVLAAGVRRGRFVPHVLAYGPYLVSASMLSLALLVTYPSWAASLLMLLGSYVLLAYPFIARNMSLAWRNLSPNVFEAAQVLGAPPVRAWIRAVLPALRPAMQTGMAFAAATALGEFAVTLFLSRPEWMTLTTLIYQRLGHPGMSSFAEAQAAAVLLLLLSSLVFGLLTWGVHASRSSR